MAHPNFQLAVDWASKTSWAPGPSKAHLAAKMDVESTIRCPVGKVKGLVWPNKVSMARHNSVSGNYTNCTWLICLSSYEFLFVMQWMITHYIPLFNKNQAVWVSSVCNQELGEGCQCSRHHWYKPEIGYKQCTYQLSFIIKHIALLSLYCECIYDYIF